MALAPGTRLAHYEIEGLLGAGGMGEVYAARDTRLEREVAIKVQPSERVEDGDSRRRLIREARLAARLNHPHICTIHDVGDEAGVAYIAMERVRGRALDQLIRPEGLAPGTVAGHGAQIADALAYAHEHGIVHRDLKSSNVLVTSGGQVKVLDFGLARQLEAVSEDQPTRTWTRPGVLVGTPHYLAPEILRGGAADVGSDLWSLGVVLYEMACGVPPFRGATLIDLGAAILNADPGPLPARVPRSLAAVIERCLAKDPAQRYRSAGEVRAALEAIGSGAPVTTGPPARRRVGGYAIAVVAIVLVATALVLDAGGIRSRLFGAAPAGRVASLAVLPLANLSHQPDQQYFADGITDELITRLAQTGGARVTSRTSVMALQGSALPLPQIARRLGVDAIVEGSVERSGDRVRISAQLIRAATDEHLWAQSYERDLRDVLALQDEVAGAIANAVEGRLPQYRGTATSSTCARSTPTGIGIATATAPRWRCSSRRSGKTRVTRHRGRRWGSSTWTGRDSSGPARTMCRALAGPWCARWRSTRDSGSRMRSRRRSSSSRTGTGARPRPTSSGRSRTPRACSRRITAMPTCS